MISSTFVSVNAAYYHCKVRGKVLSSAPYIKNISVQVVNMGGITHSTQLSGKGLNVLLQLFRRSQTLLKETDRRKLF